MDNDTICRASQGNNGEELVISFDFTIRCVDDVLSLHLFGGYVGGIYGIIFDIKNTTAMAKSAPYLEHLEIDNERRLRTHHFDKMEDFILPF
jgi:hypothetical protein